MRKSKFLTIISIVLAGIMIVSGLQIRKTLSAYHTSDQVYADLRPTETTSQPAADSSLPSEEADTVSIPSVDFTKLKKINPDIVGWIYLPDTKINYPIVQGTDNTYYLQHLFTKEKNRAGCIFLDSRNSFDFTDLHSILYGHHMKNIAMFSELEHYEKQSFYDTHPTVWILTPEKIYRLQLFSGYITKESANAWHLFSTQEEESAWIAETIQQSAFQSSVSPKAGDRIITLSTCSYDFENARFVLHGVLFEDSPQT